jgi:hypothetical protein
MIMNTAKNIRQSYVEVYCMLILCYSTTGNPRYYVLVVSVGRFIKENVLGNIDYNIATI